MSERDAIYSRVVFGDIHTEVRVEDLYQAFKARLMEELVAVKAPNAEYIVDGERVNGAPLINRAVVPA